MTPLQRKEFVNQIQRVLHVPGNYRGGILEMALVADYGISKENLEEACKEMVNALKCLVVKEIISNGKRQRSKKQDSRKN